MSLDSSHSSEKEKQASSNQLLCTIKPRINKTNAKGETCLHLAAKKGDLSLVKSLIASGACVNQKDNAGVVFLIYSLNVFCYVVTLESSLSPSLSLLSNSLLHCQQQHPNKDASWLYRINIMLHGEIYIY